jgi:hypothetical protein
LDRKMRRPCGLRRADIATSGPRTLNGSSRNSPAPINGLSKCCTYQIAGYGHAFLVLRDPAGKAQRELHGLSRSRNTNEETPACTDCLVCRASLPKMADEREGRNLSLCAPVGEMMIRDDIGPGDHNLAVMTYWKRPPVSSDAEK